MRRFLALTVACLLAAGAAIAEPAPASPPPPPPRIFLSPSGEPFRLSPTMPDPVKAWFDQADVNHLGYLDRAAFRADATRFFKKLDENGDGVIDGFEVQDYESKIVPELADWSEGIAQVAQPIPSDHGGGGHPGQHPPGGHQRAPRGQAIVQLIHEAEPVSDADFNFDSHITLDEWMRATDQRFDFLDKDKTGKLTLDELRAIIWPPPRKPGAATHPAAPTGA